MYSSEQSLKGLLEVIAKSCDMTAHVTNSRRVFLAALAAAPLAAQYVPNNPTGPKPPTGDEPGFPADLRRQDLWKDGRAIRNTGGWRDGALVGEITPETIIKSNTFIIWRGGAPADFELKAEYRITPRRQQRHQLSQRGGADTVTPTISSPCAGTSSISTAATATRGRTTRRRAACSTPCAAR